MLSVLLVTLKCDAFLSAHFSWAMGGPGTRQWQVGTCMLNYQACSHSLVPVRTFMSCCCSYCQGQLSLLNLLSQTFPLIFIWHPNCLSLPTISLPLSPPCCGFSPCHHIRVDSSNHCAERTGCKTWQGLTAGLNTHTFHLLLPTHRHSNTTYTQTCKCLLPSILKHLQGQC